MTRSEWIRSADHWVVKIGSAVFLSGSHGLDRPAFASLIEDVAGLVATGKRVTMVSSGAVALGREHMGWPQQERSDIPDLQAYAAVGQPRLMQMYANEFGHHGHKIGQVLFSRGDLDDRKRFLNARMALEEIHRLGVIPIVNENDTVATEELRFGDNDRLAAMTCGLEGADLLVILSDVSSVFEVEVDADGERHFSDRISQIGADDPHLQEVAGPSTSGVGRGGMISKVQAAQIAGRMGVPTIIGAGKERGILRQIAEASDTGTLITPGKGSALAGKKVWIGATAHASGRLTCDDGAVRALTERGASLLPSGVVSVDGDFAEGAVVELADRAGEIVGRGLAVYNAEDVCRIAGHHSDEIEKILGYSILDTVVHRDSLVML
jgi:glutamate 5-kinase